MEYVLHILQLVHSHKTCLKVHGQSYQIRLIKMLETTENVEYNYITLIKLRF